MQSKAELYLATAPGQSTGAITGMVNDPNGAVVSGATVNAKTTELSDGNSPFVAQELPVLGSYSTLIQPTGFKKLSVNEVGVRIGPTSGFEVALEAAGVTETVTVGGGELLQTQAAITVCAVARTTSRSTASTSRTTYFRVSQN